jgi:hypothetical protein
MPNGPDWTIEAYIAHIEALRDAARQFQLERDLRYQERFEAQEKALRVALANINDQVAKSDQSYNLRFDQVNEWRRTYSDLVTGTMLRSEIEQRFISIESKFEQRWASNDSKIDEIAGRLDRTDGRSASLSATKVNVLAALAILGTVAGIIGTIAAILGK